MLRVVGVAFCILSSPLWQIGENCHLWYWSRKLTWTELSWSLSLWDINLQIVLTSCALPCMTEANIANEKHSSLPSQQANEIRMLWSLKILKSCDFVSIFIVHTVCVIEWRLERSKWIILLKAQSVKCVMGTYLQLQTEGNTEHLETLHLKIHPYGCFVVLIERTLTKPHGNKGAKTGIHIRVPINNF